MNPIVVHLTHWLSFAQDKAMLKKLLIPTAATFLYCVLGQSDMGGAADLGGFIAVCGLQTLAIGYLAYN
jgi:hypothetical protein